MVKDGVPLKEHFDKILSLMQENITLARDGLEVRLEQMRKEIDALKSFRDTLDGKASQDDVNRANVISIFGFMVGLAGLLWNIFK